MKGLCEISADALSETRNVIVAGDIHGDYASFQSICRHFDARQDLMIFLGDYADRGSKGMEVIEGIRNLVREHPKRVYALKGNHEDYAEDGRPLFTPCTLTEEVTIKKGDWTDYFENELQPFMEKLYLTVIIPNIALFVHGGVSSKIKDVKDLRCPSREIEEDILWSDPFKGIGEHFNMRGAGVEFGKDISKKICNRLGVKRIVRSHQPRKARSAPHVEHDGRVITISSTTVYGGIPFILKLPTKDLNTSFNNLEDHIQKLSCI